MTTSVSQPPANPTDAANASRGASSSEPTEFIPFVNGTYRTPAKRISLLAKWFPSIVFYSKFFRTILRAGSKAKRKAYGGREWSQSSFEVLEALESVGCQFEITGAEHLQELDGPCVIVGNHMSTLETAVLPVVIQPIRECTFVVKKSLVEYPVFKHVMRSRNPIAIGQTNPRDDLKSMLIEGAERLSRGISVVVFPEGSRMGAFDPENFNSIGVKLASRAGVPIVPFALKTDAWPVGWPVSDIGKIDRSKKIHFAFDKPVRIEGRGTAEQEAIVKFITEKLAAWETEAPATLPATT